MFLCLLNKQCKKYFSNAIRSFNEWMIVKMLSILF
jgi:hypothetical protein